MDYVLNSIENGVGPQGVFIQLKANATIIHTRKAAAYYSLVEKSMNLTGIPKNVNQIELFSTFSDPNGYFGRFVSSNNC